MKVKKHVKEVPKDKGTLMKQPNYSPDMLACINVNYLE